MNSVFTGIITKGKEVFDNPERYAVHKAKLEGQRFELVLRKETHRRTDQQNRYMWGIVYEIISETTGYDPEQVHDALKEKFASHRDDTGLMVTERTSKMDTVRFTKYIDDIKRWSAEFLHCYIPDAGELEP